MKKNNYKRQKKQPDPVLITYKISEQEIQFYVDYEKSLIDWKYDKQGRNLSIEMTSELEDLDLYTQIHEKNFGKNFLKEEPVIHTDPFKMNNIFRLNDTLLKLNLNSVLFDFVVIKCTIFYEDEDQYSEFTRFHGIGLTINGKKHLAEESNNNEADYSTSSPK